MVAEPDEIGLRLSPGILEGGVRRLLMLEGGCWTLLAAEIGVELLNLAVMLLIGSSRGPGKLDVAVLLDVKLDAEPSDEVCDMAFWGGRTAAML